MFNIWSVANDMKIKRRQWPRDAKDLYVFSFILTA